jgi:hypothetical protein
LDVGPNYRRCPACQADSASLADHHEAAAAGKPFVVIGGFFRCTSCADVMPVDRSPPVRRPPSRLSRSSNHARFEVPVRIRAAPRYYGANAPVLWRKRHKAQRLSPSPAGKAGRCGGNSPPETAETGESSQIGLNVGVMGGVAAP